MVDNLKKYNFDFGLISHIVLFFTTLAVVFSNINLHYLTTNSPDYQYYKDYLSYFFGELEHTGREQGLTYFMLVSIFIKLGSDNFSLDNTNQLLSNAIQFTNLSLYLLGLFGLFFLLKYKEFKTKHILICFSIINFFPQTINMIMTMKPEIFAFAILPWSIFLVMLFLENKNYKFLYLSLIPNILLITSKGTIVGSILLLYFYIAVKDKFQFFSIKFIIIFLLFLVFMSPVLIENFNANGKHLFDHTNEKAEMQDTADLSFLYNINFRDLYMNPFRHYHANSLIGMIALDTFGDYYQWYAYNDQSAFNYIKKNYDSIWYITHWRQFFSVVLTFIFYTLIVYFYKKDFHNRHFYLMPFLGLFILLLQAYGVPQVNFDKETAELFKTHYYSYLLIICLAFVVINLIKKNIIIGYFLTVLFAFTTSFLYGVPNNNEEYKEYLYSKNIHLDTCLLNSFFIEGFEKANCDNRYINICDFDRIIYNTEKINSNKFDRVDYKKYLPIQDLINSNGKQVTPEDREACISAVKDGYYYNSIYLNSPKIPLFNLFYFIIFILSIVHLVRKELLFNTFNELS